MSWRQRTRNIRAGGRRCRGDACGGDWDGPGLELRTKLLTVGEAHEIAIPHGLEVQAAEPDFESVREGGSELPMEYLWPRYSVRITIEEACDEPIFSTKPLPSAPTVGAESSPDTTSNER
jgi:hypothetical protein